MVLCNAFWDFIFGEQYAYIYCREDVQVGPWIEKKPVYNL